MSQPKTSFTLLDGQLAALAQGGGILPVLGCSDSGTVDSPTGLARIKDVVATFGGGPMVEDAAYAINTHNLKVLCIRTGDSVAGSYPNDDAVTSKDKGAGTSTVTVDNVGSEPNGDYEVVIRFTKGGTIGTAGIEYQWSLDGGRTFSAALALGTATAIVVPDSGGVTVDLGVGTIIAGYEVSFPTRAPNFNASELGTAMDKLKLSQVAWDLALISGVLDATTIATLETKMVGMGAAGKFKTAIGSARLPDPGETIAEYDAAVKGVFGAIQSRHIALCAGSMKLSSGVSGRQYRRVVAAGAGPLEASVAAHVNTAAQDVGGIPGASIYDQNGNPTDYDESAYGTLDDGRFYVLRSWEDAEGVYPNIPRIFSAAGSDFRIIPHRRVMNLGLKVVKAYLDRRLSKPLEANPKTGYLLESEILRIEKGATRAAESVLRSAPSCSRVRVTLSRDDNVLSGAPVTGSLKIVPLAYPEEFELEAGFENPALSITAA